MRIYQSFGPINTFFFINTMIITVIWKFACWEGKTKHIKLYNNHFRYITYAANEANNAGFHRPIFNQCSTSIPLENITKLEVFRGYRSGRLVENGLRTKLQHFDTNSKMKIKTLSLKSNFLVLIKKRTLCSQTSKAALNFIFFESLAIAIIRGVFRILSNIHDGEFFAKIVNG